jgi:hypothetical protein
VVPVYQSSADLVDSFFRTARDEGIDDTRFGASVKAEFDRWTDPWQPVPRSESSIDRRLAIRH